MHSIYEQLPTVKERAADRCHRDEAQTQTEAASNSFCDESPWLEDAVAEPEPQGDELGVGGLIELLLKRREALDRVSRNDNFIGGLLPRFLMISLMGFVFYGLAMSLVLTSGKIWPQLHGIPEALRGAPQPLMAFTPTQDPTAPWSNGSAFKLTMAYAFGLIATSGVCLPSLYFYSLLSGVRMSMLDVVTQTLKSKATSALALVGLLPIYLAMAMGVLIFDVPTELKNQVLLLGLVLPFIAGLWGTRSLYRSLGGFCDTMSLDRLAHRKLFLNRLVLSWCACYTAIAPVMIFTVWQKLG